MLRGLEASTAGMLVQEHRHAVIAQNLANVSTTGYRRQVTTFHTFAAALASQAETLPFLDAGLASPDAMGAMAMAPSTASTTTPATPTPPTVGPRLESVVACDLRAGETRVTGNVTDLALHGDGYFIVQGPNGPLYTRNGAFRLDDQHQLVTEQGYPVQGEQGPVVVSGKSWSITPAGAVVVDGAVVNTLKLAAINTKTATRQGTSLWSAGAAQPAAARIEQGALEESNVNPIGEMVALIQATRQFEANMRCLQAQDSTLDRAVNDLGRM
jgi:flagellar basal-body rod protein FlgG